MRALLVVVLLALGIAATVASFLTVSTWLGSAYAIFTLACAFGIWLLAREPRDRV